MPNRQHTIDDLPRFSPWPARLLGLAPWQIKQKTPAEVIREFDIDKWGPLFQRASEMDPPVHLAEVEDWETPRDSACLCSIEDELIAMSASEAYAHYRGIIVEALKKHVPAPALVELGCGYGGVILHLATHPAFQGMEFVGAEYTRSGRALTQLLAESTRIKFSVAACDFATIPITSLPIPADSVVFTSYSAHYIPQLSPCFVSTIASWRPRTVVHFEPLFEHCGCETLLGMLRRRYIEVNDYNRNLLTLLREQEKIGKIRILEEHPAVFGRNPLLAASVVKWSPL